MTYDKPKHQIIHPEDVNTNHCYAFTFNPNSKPEIGKVNAFKVWYDMIAHLLCDVCIASKYRVYTEISCMGKFHFHGLIRITNIMNFYIHDVQTLTMNGTVVIKERTNEDEWEDYYLKQQDFIQDYLQKELYGPLVKCPDLILINSLDEYPPRRGDKA